MHHVALDRARAHDRHLDDEIVEVARLQARQHVHLRPALDLEHADRIGLGTACRRRRDRRAARCASVVASRRSAASIRSKPLRMQVSMPSASTSTFISPSASMSSLSHSMKVRSSMAALPIGTISSSRSARQHEAADMLGEMAREADQLAGELERACDQRIGGIEPGLADMLRRQAARPSCPRRCWRARAVTSSRQAQRLADLADRAARRDSEMTVAAMRGAVAAVAAIDILDHLLAPLVLEIDVDVGRLLAAPCEMKRSNSRSISVGIDGGDAEAVADGGVGGRAAPLAEDVLGCARSARCRAR